MILLLAFTFTCLMTGIVWFVQINHYPLLLKIGKPDFIAYQTAHAKTASFVIAPLMLAEFALSAALVFYETAQRLPAVTAFALLIVIWASTFLVQVPLHKKLAGGHNETYIRQLIRTNWLRTALWTLRLIILGLMLASEII